MKLFVVALKFEARPIIELYDLKKSAVKGPFTIYENGSNKLVISGINSLNSAIATTWGLSQFSSKELKDLHCINFGLCGSGDKSFEIGDLFLINKIASSFENWSQIPVLPSKHNLKEATICTYFEAVNQKNYKEGPLVDMEAFAFYKAASSFLIKEKIHVLKILSDYLEPEKIDKNDLSKKLDQSKNTLHKYVNLLS